MDLWFFGLIGSKKKEALSATGAGRGWAQFRVRKLRFGLPRWRAYARRAGVRATGAKFEIRSIMDLWFLD
jgi:hypothetical protein